jgi:hypothetical protein
MFYIVVSGATGDSFARVGPYQNEDDAQRAAIFSNIKHYRIEEASFRAGGPLRAEHVPAVRRA